MRIVLGAVGDLLRAGVERKSGFSLNSRVGPGHLQNESQMTPIDTIGSNDPSMVVPLGVGTTCAQTNAAGAFPEMRPRLCLAATVGACQKSPLILQPCLSAWGGPVGSAFGTPSAQTLDKKCRLAESVLSSPRSNINIMAGGRGNRLREEGGTLK